MVKNGDYIKAAEEKQKEAAKRAAEEAEAARRRVAQVRDAQVRAELASTADESIESAKVQEAIAGANTAEAEAAVKQAQADADMAEAKARKEKVEIVQSDVTGEKWETRNKNALRIFDGSWKWLKRIAFLIAVYYLGKGACTAIEKNTKPNPDGTTPNPIEQVGEAAGRIITTVPKVVNTGADAAEEAKDRLEDFTTRPSFLKFITEVEAGSKGKSWLPGARTLQANSWNLNNPKQPLSKEQLESILNTRKYYKDMHNGQPMPENEFYKLVDEVCPSWPKKGGKPIIHTRITGRN